jgi:hypothetical protein
MTIEFTQYLRSDGRKRTVEIDRSLEVEALAAAFLAAGGWYECEELTTGHASLTACFVVDGESQDVVIELCMNGPAVPEHVDRLVKHSVEWLEKGRIGSGAKPNMTAFGERKSRPSGRRAVTGVATLSSRSSAICRTDHRCD